jgi:nitrite reductase (NO-forming)
MKLIAGLAALAVAVVLIAAIGAVTRGTGNDPSTGSVQIVMEDLRFTPNQLNAKVGLPLRVHLTNRGTERHDLNFPSIHMPGLEGVQSIVEPGETRSVTLRFDQTGTHTFTCSLPGHAAAGMTGAVIVRP